MEQFNPCLRNFVAMGKNYEKALASKYFFFSQLICLRACFLPQVRAKSQGSFLLVLFCLYFCLWISIYLSEFFFYKLQCCYKYRKRKKKHMLTSILASVNTGCDTTSAHSGHFNAVNLSLESGCCIKNLILVKKNLNRATGLAFWTQSMLRWVSNSLILDCCPLTKKNTY